MDAGRRGRCLEPWSPGTQKKKMGQETCYVTEKYICNRNYRYQVNISQVNSKKTVLHREMQK